MVRRHRETTPCRVFDATFDLLELDLLLRLVV